MLDYYSQRAAQYERIYEKPERQADLARLKLFVAQRLAGRHILEIACGTGYWTEVIAPFARSVTAFDLSEPMLEIARNRILPADRVSFLRADAGVLDSVPGEFDAAFAGFWYSHLPKHAIARFLQALAKRLKPEARVVLIDNVFVPGNSTQISRTDTDGNTYQIRALANGSSFEVLKNFPTRVELEAALQPFARALEVSFLQYYWALCYTTRADDSA